MHRSNFNYFATNAGITPGSNPYASESYAQLHICACHMKIQTADFKASNNNYTTLHGVKTGQQATPSM
jgi:hypothetical protein